MVKKIFYVITIVLTVVACTSNSKPQKTQQAVSVEFNADSAYKFVKEQVDFGPRVPGTDEHYSCVKYLQEKLNAYCQEVALEQGTKTNYEGKQLPICNIIGRFNPEKKSRILLCAHYDTRPWADQEEDYDKRMTPIDGANDGASGVGVLLEVARQLAINQTKIGIDIVFFDAEDMGTPDFYTGIQREDTWCLGSQLWAEQHKKDAKNYQYGILLDMVGAPDAVFLKEYFSEEYAQPYLERVWQTARSLGHGRLFSDRHAYPITDDHFYINTIACIPTIDIIHYDTQTEQGFAPYWHTEADDMRNISKHTLDAVGKTVLTVINCKL